MRLRILLLFLLLPFVMVSCRRSDIRTVELKVPEMKNSACATIIVKALEASTGVQPGSNIKVDLASRTVVVSYESLVTALKNVEFAVANAGFAANEVPANQDAAKKLPPECTAAAPMVDLRSGQ